MVSVRPFGAPARRAAFALGFVIVMTAVVAGAAAWMFVPARPGGMFLVQAVAKRDVLKAWTEMPLSAGTDDAAALKREFDALAKDYPSLVGRLRPDLDRWAKAAAEAISERFRQTPPVCAV